MPSRLGYIEIPCSPLQVDGSSIQSTSHTHSQVVHTKNETIENKDISDNVITQKTARIYVLSCILLTICISILALPLLWTNSPVLDLDPSETALDTMPIIRYDSGRDEYSIYNDADTLLAVGSFASNVNGSGWHYLTVTSTDLPKTKSKGSVTPQAASDALIQAYMDRMKATGHLEGYLTCKEISQWYINFYSGLFDGGDPTDDALNFLQTNYDWMKSMSEKHWRYSEHWLAVRGYLAQLEGMVEGQNHGCPGTQSSATSSAAYLPTLTRRPSVIHFLLINANGDLYQIAEKFNQKNAPPSEILPDDYFKDEIDLMPQMKMRQSPATDSDRKPAKSHRAAPRNLVDSNKEDNADQPIDKNWLSLHRLKDHCSAIIKLLPDRSDVVFAHNTWDDYQLLGPRIFKHFSRSMVVLHKESESGPFTYHIHLESKSETDSNGNHDKKSDKDRNQLRHEVYFSSSPGLLSSVDDFYTLSGRVNLAVIETSLDIYNKDLLALIHPESLLSWMRCIVANQLAVDGDSWAEFFSAYHSGTYANQWMVVNMDRFTPGLSPETGFLTIVEEVPGYIHYEDLTSHLRIPGYWISYNNPFFDDIFILSGYLDECIADSSMCHATDPRAMIFKQREGSVVDLASLQKLIRYNDFENDFLSLNDSCNSISCRSDLQPNPLLRYPFGAIDAKVSSVMASRKPKGPNGATFSPQIFARLGPTTDGHEPFCWSQFDGKRNIRGKRFSRLGQPECYDFDWQILPLPKSS